MKIILSEDVATLGRVGDVVAVKDGYARNFLFPRRKAYPATPNNLKKMEAQKKQREAAEEKALTEAKARAEELEKMSCTVSAEVNDLDKLYGAVSEGDVAKAIQAEGFEVDRKDIVIEKPIEELGIYEVGVRVHPKVTAKVRLWVTKK